MRSDLFSHGFNPFEKLWCFFKRLWFNYFFYYGCVDVFRIWLLYFVDLLGCDCGVDISTSPGLSSSSCCWCTLICQGLWVTSCSSHHNRANLHAHLNSVGLEEFASPSSVEAYLQFLSSLITPPFLGTTKMMLYRTPHLVMCNTLHLWDHNIFTIFSSCCIPQRYIWLPFCQTCYAWNKYLWHTVEYSKITDCMFHIP